MSGWLIALIQALLVGLAGYLIVLILKPGNTTRGTTTSGPGRSPQEMRTRLVLATIGVLFCAMSFVVLAIASQPVLRRSEAAQSHAPAKVAVDAIAWVQFRFVESAQNNSNALSARALIGPNDTCPDITIGEGRGERMVRREDPRSRLFGTLCEFALTLADPRRVEITHHGKSLWKQTITRSAQDILLLGDTGCRLVQYEDQACNDAAAWPLGKLAAAAAAKPVQLVVHVGDYLYRERPCMRDELPANCNPGPHGDNEAAWRKDFFEPAKRLLAKAPWIIVRGNHEDCQRGGYGWFYYFGEPDSPVCQLAHPTSYLSLSGLTFINLDTAHAEDEHAKEMTKNEWALATKAHIGSKIGPAGPVFFLTHKPLYAVCDKFKVPSPAIATIDYNCKNLDKGELNVVRDVYANLASVAAGRPLVIVGGDIHTFQVVDVAAGQDASRANLTATQVVIGNGGTLRDDYSGLHGMKEVRYRQEAPKDSNNLSRDDANRKLAYDGTARVWHSFGFGIVKVKSGAAPSIELTMHDASGMPAFTCTLGAGLGPTTGC